MSAVSSNSAARPTRPTTKAKVSIDDKRDQRKAQRGRAQTKAQDDAFEAVMEEVVPTPKPLDLNALADEKNSVSVEQVIGTGEGRSEVVKTAAQRQIFLSQQARRKLHAAVVLQQSGKTRKRRRGSVTSNIFAAMEKEANEHRCAMIYSMWAYSFNPNERFKMSWDLFILMLVVYSCFTVPYHTVRQPDRHFSSHFPSAVFF